MDYGLSHLDAALPAGCCRWLLDFLPDRGWLTCKIHKHDLAWDGFQVHGKVFLSFENN